MERGCVFGRDRENEAEAPMALVSPAVLIWEKMAGNLQKA